MNSYSFFQMVRDISIAIINNDSLKYLTGAFLSLIGIYAGHKYSEIKSRKDKKIEILENIGFLCAKYYSYLVLLRNSEDLVNYFGQCLVANNSDLYKEEAQRWINQNILCIENIVNVSGELNKTYMSYKIFYKKDAKLKNLITNLTSSPELDFGLEGYENINDMKQLVQIRRRNIKKLNEKIRKVLKPIKENLGDYLDEIIVKVQ
jgi:hypothetical protein